MLLFNPNLRDLLVARRKVHKLFDLIKCNKWNSILEINELGDYKNLVLRDCYLSFEQLYNLKNLQQIIEQIYFILLAHIQTCSVS